MEPARVADGGERAPDRAVRQEAVAPELLGEEPGEVGDALGLVGAVESRRSPHLLPAFHDEGRGCLVERIRVHLEEAVLAFLEDEREGLEAPVGAEPRELASAPVDGRSEVLGVTGPHAAAGPVGGHHQVGGFQGLGVALGRVANLDPEGGGPLLEDLQEPLARQAGEGMSGRADPLAPEQHFDLAPGDEALRDRAMALRVGDREVAEGLLREDDAPAEGLARRVPLEDGDPAGRIELLHEDAEVEARRPSSDARDPHPGRGYRVSTRKRNLPSMFGGL